MKKILYALLVISTTSFAQTDASLSKSIESLRKAMLDSDVETLKKLSHPKITYGHSSGKIENQAEFLQAFADGSTDFTTCDFSDIQIIQEGKTAVVRHILDADTNNKGSAPGHIKLKVLLVYTKTKNGWALIARQAVRI